MKDRLLCVCKNILGKMLYNSYMQYDYSPLDSTVTLVDVNNLKKAYGLEVSETTKIAIIVLFCLFVGPIIFFIFFVLLSIIVGLIFRDARSAIAPIVFILLVIALIILGITQYVKNQKKAWEQKVRIYRFAKANNLSFNISADGPSYSGMIFNIGNSRQAEDILGSKSADFIFEIANYNYTETHGSDESRYTDRHNYGYIMVDLNKKLPHMVLDAKSNNVSVFKQSISNLPTTFDKAQVLSLEGDFDKYFKLYAPKEYERDALYILSPDLMAVLIDHSGQFDVEIVDDKMFVYSSTYFNFSDIESVKKLFKIIEIVGKKIIHQSNNYSDERISTKSIDAVSVPGQRLRSRIPLLIAIGIISIALTISVFGFLLPLIMTGIL